VFSPAEVAMLEKQSFKKESGQEDAKRPCVDFDPCKHGTCHLENDTMQFSCICNVGYMVLKLDRATLFYLFLVSTHKLFTAGNFYCRL